MAIILIGDPGQLPAIGGSCCWFPYPKNDEEKAGLLLWTKFFSENVMELKEVNRILGGPDAKKFFELLMAV